MMYKRDKKGHGGESGMKRKKANMGRMMYNKGTTKNKKNKMPRYGLVDGGKIVTDSMPIAPKS